MGGKTDSNMVSAVEELSALAISPEVEVIHFGQPSASVKTTMVMSKTVGAQYGFS